MSVAIISAIKNKNECMRNTFFSIKNQKTTFDYKLFFLDDDSTEDPKPLIKHFFDEKQVIYKKNEKSVGITYVGKCLSEMLTDDIEYVIYQSVDVIWHNKNILQNMVEELKKRECIVVPRVFNMKVDPNMWQTGNKFYSTLGRSFFEVGSYMEPKDAQYLFLAGMRRKTFMEMINHNDYICDVWSKELLFREKKLPFVVLKGAAVHQAHEHIIFNCVNIKECKYRCCRHPILEKGLKLPWNCGYYSKEGGDWENPPPR
jgi:hypothetical protein